MVSKDARFFEHFGRIPVMMSPTRTHDDEASATAIGTIAGSPSTIELPLDFRIDPLTLSSLYLKLHFGKTQLSTATGFVVTHGYRHFLVSNWHVFSGRDPETGQPLSDTCGIPDHVRVAHHQESRVGLWLFRRLPLTNQDGSPRWVTHPAGPQVDIAALELGSPTPGDVYFPLSLELADVHIDVHPSMQVSVIGFPLGLRENACFPIWKTGHIASDIDIPHRGLPAFLIDATTRAGMSGSPVVARLTGIDRTRLGNGVIESRRATRFLGVYAGRVHEHADVGRVWRPSAVREVLDLAVAE